MSLAIRFHEMLAKRITELRAAKLETMAQGSFKTWESYREAVGYLRALREIEDEAEPIRKQFTEM